MYIFWILLYIILTIVIVNNYLYDYLIFNIGRIEGNFHEGDVVVFNITANYEVDSYQATKKLVLSTLGSSGGRNMFLGVAYTTIGSLCMVFGFVLLIRVFWNDIADYYDMIQKQR